MQICYIPPKNGVYTEKALYIHLLRLTLVHTLILTTGTVYSYKLLLFVYHTLHAFLPTYGAIHAAHFF